MFTPLQKVFVIMSPPSNPTARIQIPGIITDTWNHKHVSRVQVNVVDLVEGEFWVDISDVIERNT
jgi:hypothetical protein